MDALNPTLLHAFIAVAEELHFRRAAERLHISQPPLSMQVRKLETLLGAKLFDRDRRRVTLTEAGASFLPRARQLLADAERAFCEVGRIARGEEGTLVIGYTPTATYSLLPPLLRAYRPRHVQLVEMRSALQPGALASGQIDLGLACGPIDAPGLSQRVLVRERFVVALQKKERRLRLVDLHGRAVVSVRADIEPAWANACRRALAGIELELVQETDSKIALLGLVAAGLGIAFVSESMLHIKRDGIVYQAVEDLRVRVPLVALTRPTPSPRVLRFLGQHQAGPLLKRAGRS